MWARIINPFSTHKMARPTIKILIEEDLGYCCQWFFFNQFRRTAVVAMRLGVTDRAIRYVKAEMKEGCLQCEDNPRCMKRFARKPRG
jgi:hypothetical protein